MKLVIDIPDKDYEFIRDAHILWGRRNGKQIEYNMINAIKNGTRYEERPKYKRTRCGVYHSLTNYCPNCGTKIEWKIS